MSVELIVVVLFAWAVVGLLAAIAFGRMVQEIDISSGDEEILPSSAGTVKYLRRNRHKPQAQHNDAPLRRSAAKRATG